MRAGSARWLLALALAPVLAVSGCGDGEPELPSEPPAELLREAVANPASSGESAIGIDLLAEGDSLLAGSTSVDLQGPFALDEAGGLPSFDFALDAEVAGFGVDGAVVSTGEDAFVVFFGENYRVGPERTAELESSLQEGLGAQGGLRVDEWIRDPRYEGVEEVGGEDAVRIVGVSDPIAAVSDLSAMAQILGVPPRLLKSVGVSSAPVEAWVALSDRTLRRLRLQLAFEVPVPLQAQAAGIAAGAVTLDAEISDVGAEVTIEPPAGGGFQPIEDLIQELQDLASLGGI